MNTTSFENSNPQKPRYIPKPVEAIAAYKLTHNERAYTKLYWDVANVIGIPQALLVEIIEKWCQSNERCNKRGYFHDGEWWTSATYSEWVDKYPALGKTRTIQTLLLGLEKSGYVVSCQPKAVKGDKSKFYRVNAAKVGMLLLLGNEPVTEGMTQKMDDANDTKRPIVQNLRDDEESMFQPPMTQKMDDANDTKRPIVQNFDPIAQNFDPIAQNFDIPRPESYTQQASQALNKINLNKITQSITAIADEREKRIFEEEEQPKEAIPDSRFVVKEERNSAPSSKTLHEGDFSAAPNQEKAFLGYYRTYQKIRNDKDINNVASYLTTCLSKGDEGAAEINCLFNEWKRLCGELGRKLDNYADHPDEIARQKDMYDFENWEQIKHVGQYETLKRIGLAKFCSTSKISTAWYAWAIAKYPERFVDIPS